eukprot:TRINITY_DN5111_c0_g1_i1.p1 TRINITY_DN5111_c0_g1~~TRINITY_DN5111_c0_g1_i1.p1  ORF type:complete len:226 (-),score=28.03 TRINITY_DN5111_c0_g1_i1:27-704(-)
MPIGPVGDRTRCLEPANSRAVSRSTEPEPCNNVIHLCVLLSPPRLAFLQQELSQRQREAALISSSFGCSGGAAMLAMLMGRKPADKAAAEALAAEKAAAEERARVNTARNAELIRQQEAAATAAAAAGEQQGAGGLGSDCDSDDGNYFSDENNWGKGGSRAAVFRTVAKQMRHPSRKRPMCTVSCHRPLKYCACWREPSSLRRLPLMIPCCVSRWQSQLWFPVVY